MEGTDGVDDVAAFAALLRALKERTDRSYGSLARRLAMNTSTLHRYCAGEAVPVDFAPVERLAALCGARPEERLELHRRWLLAVAARQRPRGAATAGSAETAGRTREAGAVNPAADAGKGRAPQDTSVPHGAGAAEEGRAAPTADEGWEVATTQDTGTAHDADADAAHDADAEQDAHAPQDPGTTQAPGTAQDPGTTQNPGTAQDADASQAADASQDPAEAQGAHRPVDEDGAPRDTNPAPAAGPVARPATGAALPRRPWYRRRRLAVGMAAVSALLAALGTLAALPDGRRAAADDRARAAGPATSGATGTGTPERHGSSAAPSTSPTPHPSSPSAGPKEKGERKKEPAPAPSARTTAPPKSGTHGTGTTPLTWTVNSQAWKFGCGHDYVVTKPPAQVPPPPVPQDAGTWAATQSAVHGGETLVQLSVQGRSDRAVVLDALRVRVVGRAAPVRGNAYAMDQGCGGSVTPRSFDVDLDKDRPIARAVAGSDAGTPIPAVSMPYRVSARDPEVLLVNARTRGCDCRWYLELDWSSEGRTGTVRIDDAGRPFRTSGIADLPRYTYDTSARRWRQDS
ncbi:helix-turn-helix domain-containing protein [Streptomyces sp. NPDC003877]